MVDLCVQCTVLLSIMQLTVLICRHLLCSWEITTLCTPTHPPFLWPHSIIQHQKPQLSMDGYLQNAANHRAWCLSIALKHCILLHLQTAVMIEDMNFTEGECQFLVKWFNLSGKFKNHTLFAVWCINSITLTFFMQLYSQRRIEKYLTWQHPNCAHYCYYYSSSLHLLCGELQSICYDNNQTVLIIVIIIVAHWTYYAGNCKVIVMTTTKLCSLLLLL